jgi:hypothetical protein
MSNVTSGAVLTLVIPLALLMVVLAIWAVRFRRARTMLERTPADDGR